MAHHPPHPQFLDVDWPQNHGQLQSQSLQLENEYDIDPSRYDILQGEVHPPHNMERHLQHDSAFTMNNNNYDRQPFDGSGDYMFTFPNPQPHQHYGNSQLYAGASQFPSMAHQSMSMPSSPYYPEDTPAFTYAQEQGVTIGQHARTNPNPNPGLTPTVQSFQGNPQRTPAFSNSESITPDLASKQNYGMPTPLGRSYRDERSPHTLKRMRVLDDGEGEVSSADGEGYDDSGAHSKEEGAKPAKPPGACARCKGLKVKCEFKTDPDICKRCLNGGHECVIPGRKKRRAPPRRDLLLSQIREQASKIEDLMKQLEEANKRAGAKQPRDQSAAAPSPPRSVTTTENVSSISCASELAASEFSTPEPAPDHITKPDVLDWIAKARESIEAFGGYINMGGPSVTKSMLGEDVLGWRDSSDSSEGAYEEDELDDVENKSDIHVEIEDADGKHIEMPRGRSHPEDVASTVQGGDETARSSRRDKSKTAGGRERLAILPNEAAPIGMLANLSLKKSRRTSRSRSVSTTEENDYGVASEDYFRASSPGPDRDIMYAQHQTPYILRSGLVNPAEVEKLFKIFFDYMNPSVSLLDPVLYSAQKTYWRSPFLFTVICGVSSRFYAERPELYQQAMNCARLAGGSTLIGGQKSVETVAAYLLLGLYPVTARKWEEDRCWVYTGLAMRIATDLNLHLAHTAKPRNEQHAREMLNRTRLWLNCFNVDRSIASQYGKAPIISNTDYIAIHSETFYKSSPYNMRGFDVHLCGYNAELTVLAEYRLTIFSDPEHPVGLNKRLDITVEASKTDDKLARLWEIWLARINEDGDQSLSSQFRTLILKVAYSYARMTVLSFAFQHTFGRDTSQGFNDAFFWRCLRASKDVIRTLVDDIGTPRFRIFLRHGPEAECVFVTFTCAFLIKLLHPKFANYIPRETRVEIRSMVEEVADVLGHPEVSIDDRHGPKMYSRFLKDLLEAPLASVDHSPAALKRATRSLAASLSDPESVSDRPSASPVPAATASSLSPPDTDTLTPSDTQMFDGLEFDYSQATQPADVTDLYAPPLPFDTDLMQSMHTLTESTWSSMVLPGFSWMDAMQQDPNDQMPFHHNLGASSDH